MNIPIPKNLDGKVIEDIFIKKPKINKFDYENNKKSFLTDFEINKINNLKKIS